MSKVISQSPVKSFAQMLDEVKERVEIACFEKKDRAMAEEICLIIAEIDLLPTGTLVRIGGEDLPRDLVSDVYAGLRNDHVAAVMEKYRRATYQIKRKKTYLRTALYNEVFEHELGELNDFNATWGGM